MPTARRLPPPALALILLASSACGSDTPGGTLTIGTAVEGSITSTDPDRSAAVGPTLRGDPHQDAWTTTLTAGTSYVLEVCPTLGGWDPVINVVPDDAGDTTDRVFCELAGDSSPETCVFAPAAGGGFTVYVGSENSLDTETATRSYSFKIAPGDGSMPNDCPVRQQ